MNHRLIVWCVASLLAVSVGVATAATVRVTSAAELKTALGRAQPGDEIVLADGRYAGNFRIVGTPGTAERPITLRAERRHQAILEGNGQFSDKKNYGLIIASPYWVIQDLQVREYAIGLLVQGVRSNVLGVSGNAHHVEVRDTLVYNFGARGIEIEQSKSNVIARNVVALSPAVSGYSTYAGIEVGNDAQHNRIEDNIVYSITNDGHMCGDAGGCSVGAKAGYALQIRRGRYNTLRGNLLMDSAKGGIRVFSVPSDRTPTDANVVSDNISAHSESGTISASDAQSSHNRLENNLIYGVYYAAWSAKGNRPGQNVFRHNTAILTPFSRLGAMLNEAFGRPSLSTTVEYNLLYADFPNPSTQWLWRVDTWAGIRASRGNLLWRPGAKWTQGVRFHATDIREQPIFVDPENGDFSLAPGSPGSGAAPGGRDVGIQYNRYLKKSWAREVVRLPTQEKTPSGKSLSFKTAQPNQYQVYVYIPHANPYRGTERFTIEGQTIKRDYKTILASPHGWVSGPPIRWIYLGTHPNDGELDVSWTQGNSVEKLLIRQLPTVEEAYGWIRGEAPEPAPVVSGPTAPPSGLVPYHPQ